MHDRPQPSHPWAAEPEPTPPGPRHLFDSWPEVAGRLAAASRRELFPNLDGTLAAFRRSPEKVVLTRATRRALERLARLPGGQIWIISGRRRADIQRRIGLERIRYLGLHGAENESHPDRPGKYLLAARQRIADAIQPLLGVWVEDKGGSFTIHYREASAAAVRHAEGRLAEILDEYRSHLCGLSGHCAWEIVPRDMCDKGVAVQRETRRLRDSTLVIYVGDDGTDELAFAALPEALTVCVAPRRSTRAKFVLRSTTEVRRFLDLLRKEFQA